MKNLEEIKDFCKKHNFTLKQLVDGELIEGSLYLSSLTSLPENITFNVEGYLDLSSLTSLPGNITFNVGGSLCLRSLTSLPENITFNVGCSLYLSSLTSLPENITFNVGGSLDLSSFLSNKGINKNKILNGYKFTANNINYIFADKIMAKIKKERNNVYYIIPFGKINPIFLVEKNGKFSHGNTLKEAKEDLIFKIADRDKSYFKNININEQISFEKAIECYRIITGACSFGTKDFVKNRLKDRKKKYTINEIAELTKGEYRNTTFRHFYNL